MSIFDPKTFGSLSFNQANDTKSIPLPAEEFAGIIKSAEVKPWESRDKSKSGAKLTVMWLIDGNERCQDGRTVKEVTGRDENAVKQDVMLDLTQDGRGLDFGKGMNVRLGKLREAIGLNKPGATWSFEMFPGNMARIMVSHRPDEQDPEILYAEVKAVAKLG